MFNAKVAGLYNPTVILMLCFCEVLLIYNNLAYQFNACLYIRRLLTPRLFERDPLFTYGGKRVNLLSLFTACGRESDRAKRKFEMHTINLTRVCYFCDR
jgi:hypothetical protein